MYLVREPRVGPPLLLYLTEPARSLAGLAALPLAAPWLAMAPRGDGHGVLVLPGLLASDFSTAPLRRFLGWLGYDVHGWELGRNRGPAEAVLDGLPQALAVLAARAGRSRWWAGACAGSSPGNWPAGTRTRSGT
jgi:hypothetical protein